MLFASGGQATDLIELYRDAQLQDPILAAARAAYAATIEALPQARAGLLPSIGLTASSTYNNTTESVQGLTPAQNANRFNNNGFAITAIQPLFRAQNFALYEESKIQVEQAGYILASAELDLIQRVAQRYFDALLAQDNVDLVGAQKAAIAENLAQAKRNFDVGTATITDTNDAQARYDQIVAQEIAAKNDLELKRQALQVLIGKLPGALKPLTPNLDLHLPDPNDMDDWVARAEQHNFTVRNFDAALRISDYEVDRIRADRLPTLDLVAGYTDSSAGSSLSGNPPLEGKTKTIGVQLSVPLFAGGGISSKIRQAIAARDQARQNLEFNRRTAAQNTRTAFLGVANGAAQVRALEQAVVSNETAVASAKLGVQVGVRTNLDLLNTEQQLYSARHDLYQARYAYLISKLQLKAAVGELTDEQIEEINRLLTFG